MKYRSIRKRIITIALGCAMVLAVLGDSVYATELEENIGVEYQSDQYSEELLEGSELTCQKEDDSDSVAEAGVNAIETENTTENTAVIGHGTTTENAVENTAVAENVTATELVDEIGQEAVTDNLDEAGKLSSSEIDSELSIAWDIQTKVYGDIATDPNAAAGIFTEDQLPKLEATELAVAIGTTRQILIPEFQYTTDYGIPGVTAPTVVSVKPEAEFSFAVDQAIPLTPVASIDTTGLVTALSKGKITISVSYSYTYEGILLGRTTQTVVVNVTDPWIPSTDLYINLYGVSKNSKGEYSPTENFTFDGLVENSVITAVVDPSLSGSIRTKQGTAKAHKNILYLYPTAIGDYTMTINVDGREFKCNIIILNVYFKRNSRTVGDKSSKKWVSGRSTLCLKEGEEVSLTAMGYAETETKVWASSNPEVATVDDFGNIEATGIGDATISVTAHNFPITYQVTVTYPVALKAIQFGYKHWQSTYSQAKRMSKGYFDCSSFVWRAYKSAGFYIGNKNIAPTAADQARWCMNNNYIIYSGTVEVSKLQAGDLIYWTGANNHRYNGIYHVDMYIGNSTRLTVPREQYLGETITKCMVARFFGNKGTGLSLKKTPGQKSVMIAWETNVGCTGYCIYRATKKNGKYKKIKTIKNANNYTDKKVSKNKTYYYRVRPFYKGNGKTYYGKYSTYSSVKVK